MNEQAKDSIRFKGYAAIYPKHPITGLAQLEYDQQKPYEQFIPYYNEYLPKDSIAIPKYYIVGGQETEVLKNLQLNGVVYQVIDSFYLEEVNCFVVKDYKAPTRPYEGHFKLSNIEIENRMQKLQLKPGDILVPSKQDRALFIHSVLQPNAEDSYLSWNFFDSYLQQKEYFSAYVFKSQIEEILAKDPNLKKAYEEKKALDIKFSQSEWEQLLYIYQRSPYFEQTFMRLPIYLIH